MIGRGPASLQMQDATAALTFAGGADGGQRGFTSDAEVRCVVRRLDARLYGPTPPHTTAAYAGPDDA